MTAPAMPMPTPIPTPENFPVTWEAPEEAMLLWEQEQMHSPHSITPLSAQVNTEIIEPSLSRHGRGLGLPIQGTMTRRINTYIFRTAVPDFALIEGTEDRIKATVQERGFGMYARWESEFLPRIEALNQELRTFDYAGATDDELRVQFARMFEILAEEWDIHFTLLPGFLVSAAFKMFCAGIFGFAGLEAYEMMQGSWSMSVESGSKLWQLAQSAPPSVRQVIERQPSAAALAELESNAEGQTFLAGLRDYLEKYGWRSGTFDLIEPSWSERPELAIDNIRLMFRVPTDPADDQARGAAQAEVMANECRAKLEDNPAALGQFEFMLQAARAYPQLQENHNFHIDQKGLALCRLGLNEIGARMAAAGVVSEANDIHYLTREKIDAFLGGSRDQHQEQVAAAKAEMAHFSSIRPPLRLGSNPPVENPDPFLNDFFGRSIIEPSGSAKELKGTASSRGRVTGTARVIRTLAAADRVQEGDILVCDMTTPAWTPLFASLAAIVSDSGGPLSHCAVVAREYGVPCVTGTRIATSFIPDGATITVDGGTGLVRIES